MTAATGFVYHEDYLRHDTGAHHPERAERLTSIMRRLEAERLTEQLERILPVHASPEQIEYVHTVSYVEEVEAVCKRGGGMLDPDTPVCGATCDIAALAAGGAITAVDEVMNESNALQHVFALVRPPGHHANANNGRGFCIFNNIAIAAEYLKRDYGMKRILIADWDVHHGNGTQEVFFDDPSVLYFSMHQYPYYPGTGWLDEVGRGEGKGFTVDVPLPSGTNDAGYLYALDSILVPIAQEFRPEFVLVSAGFDSHGKDPLASMALTSSCYGIFTDTIKELAKQSGEGRIVLTLEGGYNLDAIAESVLSVFYALLSDLSDQKKQKSGAGSLTQRVIKRVEQIRKVQKDYWSL